MLRNMYKFTHHLHDGIWNQLVCLTEAVYDLNHYLMLFLREILKKEKKKQGREENN